MPEGTITGAHFVKTKHYVQITGTGNFTKINVPIGDYGGELDNKGPLATGNPGASSYPPCGHEYKLTVNPSWRSRLRQLLWK